MIVGFEDALTNAQADYILLCVEFAQVAQIDVDVVYGFIYQVPGMKTCNVFFKVGEEIKSIDDIGSDELIDRFFDCGYEDIAKLIEVCDRYEHKCPNQIKMIYNAKTKAFDAEYFYNDSASDDADPDEIFFGWMDEELKRRLAMPNKR